MTTSQTLPVCVLSNWDSSNCSSKRTALIVVAVLVVTVMDVFGWIQFFAYRALRKTDASIHDPAMSSRPFQHRRPSMTSHKFWYLAVSVSLAAVKSACILLPVPPSRPVLQILLQHLNSRGERPSANMSSCSQTRTRRRRGHGTRRTTRTL